MEINGANSSGVREDDDVYLPVARKAAIPSSRNAIHSLNFDGDVGGRWAAVNWWGTVFLFSFFSNLINFKILMISLILNANA